MVLRDKLGNRYEIEEEFISDFLYRLYSGHDRLGNTGCLLQYHGRDISTLIHQHIAPAPAAPSAINPDIPPIIDNPGFCNRFAEPTRQRTLVGNSESYCKMRDNIILRLIAKDPQDRYQTAAGLSYDLAVK